MNFNVTFSESNQSFNTAFGEVHDISDGGFERGYTAGEEAMCEELLGGEW